MADKITVGNVEITAVMDMVPPPRPPEQMFPEVSQEDWGPYEDILENKETAFLLQGYDFAGFSDWYRSNCRILRKKELSEDCSLLDEEFDRDLKFFDVLVGSADYLMVNFEKALTH